MLEALRSVSSAAAVMWWDRRMVDRRLGLIQVNERHGLSL
jgi:hypothetical protein